MKIPRVWKAIVKAVEVTAKAIRPEEYAYAAGIMLADLEFLAAEMKWPFPTKTQLDKWVAARRP